MRLADILSLDGLHRISTVVQDRILTLRLVSRKIMMALESNVFINIHLHINDAGVDHLTSNLLTRWHGSVHLYCTRPWNPDSRWFKEVRDALSFGRLRPLSRLSVSVLGNNLHPLVESLVGITPAAIKQLEIDYRGDGAVLLAAAGPFAALGSALTMKISVEGTDHGAKQISSWLQHLLKSSIRIKSISFRSCTNSNFLPSPTLSPPITYTIHSHFICLLLLSSRSLSRLFFLSHTHLAPTSRLCADLGRGPWRTPRMPFPLIPSVESRSVLPDSPSPPRAP
jgi:hypothetical protein